MLKISSKKLVKLMVFYLINQKKIIMTVLVTLRLRMVVAEMVFMVLVVLAGQIFQISLRILGDFGGGRRSSRRSSNNRGSDLRYDLSISLEEAYQGKKQNIQFSTSEKCNTCKGNGLNQVLVQMVYLLWRKRKSKI